MTCGIEQKQCTVLNGMGNPITIPISDAVKGLTVVCNADLKSGNYICGDGICVDKEQNVVGRDPTFHL